VLAGGEDANLQSQLTAKQLVTELVVWTASSPASWICWKRRLFSSEASDELRHYCDRLDLDPNRLFELAAYLRQIALARKHHVTPEELPALSGSAGRAAQLDDQRRLAGILSQWS
jgi:DNA repair protein RecN (Recombination protein N)